MRALGQATDESVESILTRLLSMQPTDDLKVMLETHPTLVRCLHNFPSSCVHVTIDMVLKFYLNVPCFVFFVITLRTPILLVLRSPSPSQMLSTHRRPGAFWMRTCGMPALRLVQLF